MNHLSLVRRLEPAGSSNAAGASLEALAQRALGGDPSATKALLEAMLPAVRSACRALLGSGHADLDDAVQNALIAVHRALPGYRGECSLLHYAVRITFRTIHGFRRRLRLLAERFLLSGEELELNDLKAPQAADAAIMTERSEALRRLMTRLPRLQAEALLLHIGLGYPLAEVATISEVSVNTIKTRIRLGKDSLRRSVARDRTLRSVFGGNP